MQSSDIANGHFVYCQLSLLPSPGREVRYR